MQKYKSLSLIHQAHDHLLAQLRPNINFIILICAISAFLAGKSHPTLLRGWPGSTGYQIFVMSSQSLPHSTLICHYLLLFVTIRDYSSLFATIRDYSPLFALFVLFVTIRCSVFATVRYSLFGFSRHPSRFSLHLDVWRHAVNSTRFCIMSCCNNFFIYP